MKLDTKAKTIDKLSKFRKFNIAKHYFFNVKNFNQNKNKIIENIQSKFKNKKIAIRSSTLVEDNKKMSMAGQFLSILNIDTSNKVTLIENILKVINSYKNYKNYKNEVLIQEMINNIFISGVITTKDKNTSLPYFNIDYSYSKDSTVVTGGTENTQSATLWKGKNPEKKFKKLILIVYNLLKLFKEDSLDIEFIISKDKKVHILQVRRLITKKKSKLSLNKFEDDLIKVSKKIKKIQKRHYNLLGKTSYFGVMPDWNPAEIIGLKPKPLSLSLYKELISDHIWSIQRKNYGYRDLTSHHLILSLLGKPFVDLRVDFNSWVPLNLNKNLGEKLVNFYLDKFNKNLHLHDKIEFDIIFSCFTLSTNQRLKELDKSFKKNEINKIRKELKKITNYSIQKLQDEKEKIKNLEVNFKKIINSNLYIIDKIYWLIEDCKKNGTEVFAGAARCGFVAIDLLNSFYETKIINLKEKNLFLNNIETVSSKISKDFNFLSKKEFVKLHGHLRPNTYEITSDTYKNAYEKYFTKTKLIKRKKVKIFKLSKKSRKLLNNNLEKNDFKINSSDLLSFIKEAIIFREYSKYVFTKHVSKILDLLRLIGKRNKITVEKMSFIDIQTIINLHRNLSDDNISKLLQKEADKNMVKYEYYKNFNLPDNIINCKDVFNFKNHLVKPNYITDKNISAKLVRIKNENNIPDCNSKIVLIENADPGYEFLFTKNIKGIITKYGGINSHMAIRCSELNIAAAIGVGDKKFNELNQTKFINLNCALEAINKI